MNQFDYIIVGGGSAGCVLANRLSADASQRILLLEAGGEDKDLNIRIPAAFSKLFKTKYDWNDRSVSQPNLKNRKLYQPRGKVLGGSSSINAMIYIRGHQQDYDHWASLGNQGWAYEEILPYFKRSEGQLEFRDTYHGTDGPLTVGPRNYTNPLTTVFLQAAEELGFTLNPDMNGEKQEGFGLYQVTQKDGARCSAAAAFLHPVRHRENLEILTGALVERIILEDQKAVGVIYHQGGQQKTVLANREVILSAGAFHSPKILLLSGIGPGKELRQLNIETVHDLPGVGKNLQDHLSVLTAFTCSRNITLDSIERFPTVLANLFRYFSKRQGPFASNIAEAGGFVKSDPQLKAPDVQFHFGPLYFLEHGFVKPKGNGYSIGPQLLQPESRGEVCLQSVDPNDPVLIDPKYLSKEEDLQKLIWGFRLAQRIGMSDAFAAYRMGPFEPDKVLENDDEIEAYIRHSAEILYHPVGTCKMGYDKMAVVDEQLRVHGIPNLRVADASIMPTIIRGNTNAPTIMIAEKAAEMIRSYSGPNSVASQQTDTLSK